MTIRTVLFDLDGTLLDTAPDIAYALNQIRSKHSLPELPFTEIRPLISSGINALVKLGFGIDENHAHFKELRKDCLAIYQEHASRKTRLFPNMEIVLEYLESHQILWGIVTNKPTLFTIKILTDLNLSMRAACIVCGDTLTKSKPDPDSILHGCMLLQQQPNEVVYIGDSKIDAQASKAAGLTSIIALYGYIDVNDDPLAWKADAYINNPLEIIEWLQQNGQMQ